VRFGGFCPSTAETRGRCARSALLKLGIPRGIASPHTRIMAQKRSSACWRRQALARSGRPALRILARWCLGPLPADRAQALIISDGYFYKSQKIDRLQQAREIAASLPSVVEDFGRSLHLLGTFAAWILASSALAKGPSGPRRRRAEIRAAAFRPSHFTSCFRRGRPGRQNASFTERAERSCSISRNTSYNATSGPVIASSMQPRRLDDVELARFRPRQPRHDFAL